jgi:imidazolonepropionase-like amidohydrolase
VRQVRVPRVRWVYWALPMSSPAFRLLLAATLAAVAGHEAVSTQTPQPGVVAITNATVLTVTRGTIERGTVLVRDGRIAAVGADVAIPRGAEVVDAAGRFVSPGIIDAHSHIAADSINEGGTTVSSMTGIEDVFNPTDINIYRDLAGGVTTANVLHGSANPIGGKNFVMKLRWGKTTTDEFRLAGALPGIKFALGENPKDMRQFGQQGPRRYPTSRMGVEFVIRDAFARAKAYQAEWKAYEASKKSDPNAIAPRRDLQLEPLVEVLEGKRLVHAHSYRADEILMMLRVAEEIGFRVATLQHVLEGYKVAKEIAAHGAGASTFSDWWGYKVEASGATPWNAALMTRKGVLVSINSDSAEHSRRLNTEAAKAIKWGGLKDDEALALVTINPAKQLRVDARVGSIETGKDADLVIWNRHPLSSYAVADRVYIDGTLYYDRANEDARVDDIARRKDELLKAERKNEKKDEKKPGTKDEGQGTKDEGTKVPTVPTVPPTAAGTNGGGTNGHGASGTNGHSMPRAVLADTPIVAIVNARIHPITTATIERGAILLKNGRIEAVGPDVKAPAGAKVIDAAGGDVYPGLIDPSTAIGLDEPGPRGFADTAESVDYNPHLRTRVAFHPDSDAIPVARSNGITTVGVAPGGGVLGGEVAVMDLDGWTWEDATVRPSAGITFQFPSLTPPRRFGAAPERDQTFADLKKARDKKLETLADLLARARAYARITPSARPVDYVLAALVPVVDREVPFFVSANLEADIRDAVAFGERERVRLVIEGGAEAWRVAALLAEKNVPVVLGPVLQLPTRQDDHHAATYRAASILANAGVTFALSGGNDATNVRLLPYQASQSVAWGLDRERALRAITIDAATILGVAHEVGSLEVGKRANLFVSKGDPLEVRTEVTHVFIQGRDVGVDNVHKRLYEKHAARP